MKATNEKGKAKGKWAWEETTTKRVGCDTRTGFAKYLSTAIIIYGY